MYKLVVLALFFVAVSAAPSLLHAPLAYSTVVGSIPTSISHQSSSVVHSAAIAAPVVHAAPVVATYAAAPLISHAPFVAAGVHPW
nr:cuticle protein 64-like [Onthophagus taurus]